MTAPTPSPLADPAAVERARIRVRDSQTPAGPERVEVDFRALMDLFNALASPIAAGGEVKWSSDLGSLIEAQRVTRRAYRAIETEKAQNTHIPGNPYDVALSALNSPLAALDTLITARPAADAQGEEVRLPMIFYDGSDLERRLVALAELIERHPDEHAFSIIGPKQLAVDLRTLAAQQPRAMPSREEIKAALRASMGWPADLHPGPAADAIAALWNPKP